MQNLLQHIENVMNPDPAVRLPAETFMTAFPKDFPDDFLICMISMIKFMKTVQVLSFYFVQFTLSSNKA